MKTKIITSHADVKKYRNCIYNENILPHKRLKVLYLQFERKKLHLLTDLDDINSFNAFYDKVFNPSINPNFVLGYTRDQITDYITQIRYLRNKVIL